MAKINEKFTFAVDDAKIIDEDPNSRFAKLELDFFASGENRHEMYVSEETLERTSDTIKNVPLVWIYDIFYDDIGGHDVEEVPCGFVPETAEIKKRKLSDGRKMLSTTSYI